MAKKDEEQKKGLAGFLSGPIGDLLLGAAIGTVTTGNPLTGVLAAPVINRQRSINRAADQQLAEDEFVLDEKKRLSQLAQDIPIMANAGKNPITGEMVAPEPGITDPYLDQGQRLGLAAQFPHLTNTMFPQQSNRMNPAQMYDFFVQKAGREPDENELKAIMGMNRDGTTMEDQLKLMELQLRVESLSRELQGDVDAEAEQEQVNVNTLNNLAHNLDMMDTSMSALEGTPFAPGGGPLQKTALAFTGPAQWALELAGQDEWAKDLERYRTNYDLLKKSSSQFVGNILQEMNSRGITVTRGLQQLAQDMNANPDMSIGSIRAINQLYAKEIMKSPLFNQIDQDMQTRVAQIAASFDGQFGSEEEAAVAANQGLIQPGDTVYINGEAYEYGGN